MSIIVRFRLRPTKMGQTRQVPIQCRITVDGQEDSGFSCHLKIDAEVWSQAEQRATGRGDQAQRVNKHLTALRAKLEQIHDWQFERFSKQEGPKPTCQTIKYEYATGKRPTDAEEPGANKNEPKAGMTLLNAYRSYIIQLYTEKNTGIGLDQKTIDKWEYGLSYLERFLGEPGKNRLAADASIGWAKRYHVWLLQQPNPNNSREKLGLESATRYVSRLVGVLDYLLDFGALPGGNPLARLKLPRGSGKEVYFLDMVHIDKLFTLAAGGNLGVAIWWARLMTITGMDYVDAVRYARSRATYTKETPFGEKIVIRRSKPPRAECQIPVNGIALELLRDLFKQYPTGPIELSQDAINQYLYNVEVLIGYDRRITCKILRKTAGAWMLWRGFRLEAVSKALGHGSVAVTERSYVKITGTLIDIEMRRVGA